MTDDATVTPGSGNVFADLGFDNPEEELLKAKLGREIRARVRRSLDDPRPDLDEDQVRARLAKLHAETVKA